MWALFLLVSALIITLIVFVIIRSSCSRSCYEGFKGGSLDPNSLIVCFPACKKYINVLNTAIRSFVKHNDNISVFVFNNNELSKAEIEELHRRAMKAACGTFSMYAVDVSPWMDIFKDMMPLKKQWNNYIRLVMPLFFQEYFPSVRRFMYCDEDCLCVGDVRKLYNIHFREQFAGFIDLVPLRNLKSYRPDDMIDYLFVDEMNYINSGLLIFKTTFDLTKIIKGMNMSVIFGLLLGMDSHRICHDQFVLNLYPHHIIPLKINKMYSNRYKYDRKGSDLIKQCLQTWNVAHTYVWKNDIPLMRKQGMIP